MRAAAAPCIRTTSDQSASLDDIAVHLLAKSSLDYPARRCDLDRNRRNVKLPGFA